MSMVRRCIAARHLLPFEVARIWVANPIEDIIAPFPFVGVAGFGRCGEQLPIDEQVVVVWVSVLLLTSLAEANAAFAAAIAALEAMASAKDCAAVLGTKSASSCSVLKK